MSDFYAVRNISKCTKDCLCLYVCPTGATNTENSIIDKSKCIGCGACSKACPSGAITLVPTKMPKEQEHNEEVINSMKTLMRSKAVQENIASLINNKLAKAIEKSCRISAEDITRESGYMLPQSKQAKAFLESLKDIENAPLEVINKLLDSNNLYKGKE